MQQNKKITTPVATAVWPSLNEPDYRFDENGIFNVRLRFDPTSNEDHATFIAKLEAQYEKAVESELAALTKAKRARAEKAGKAKADSPLRPVFDDQGEETGEVEINFKMRASGVSRKSGERWTRKPTLFDAAGNKTTAIIGGGSQIKVAFTMGSFFMATVGAGLSLRLEAVQIVELVAPGGTADSFGFDAIEGGFDSSSSDDFESAPASASDDSDDDF